MGRPLRRLAGPMARRPIWFIAVSLLVCAAAATGFMRFGVDAGQSLLVGSRSDADQTYQRFTQQYGSDPIVVVFTARNPAALYYESNLDRFAVVEREIRSDPNVASVLGPGTVRDSIVNAAGDEAAKVEFEYSYYIAETRYVAAVSGGEKDAQKLTAQFQQDMKSAQSLLGLSLLEAAGKAEEARLGYDQKGSQASDQLIESREQLAITAAKQAQIPPLFSSYLAGPGNPTNDDQAAQLFAEIAADYGPCNAVLASTLGVSQSCQQLLESSLLDLKHCPTVSQNRFCAPRAELQAIFPPAAQPPTESFAVMTVRLTSSASTDPAAAREVRDRINATLSNGLSSADFKALVRKDSQGNPLDTASLSGLLPSGKNATGSLVPTECGVETQATQCDSKLGGNPAMEYVVAGAPLLAGGVVDAMTRQLLVLLPLAIFLMLLLLAGFFRVRSRLVPLGVALVAAAASVGLTLWTGTRVTPALLAGMPVLLGLGVDYAVQLVARLTEERAAGADLGTAVARVVGSTGPATGVAALATLAGLGGLALVTGIDAGPLVAIPLIAQFSLVLCGGVIAAWLAATFIALPAAIISERRRRSADAAPAAEPRPVRAGEGWRWALALGTIAALAGWVLTPFVPVNTDVEGLLAPNLAEVQQINQVRAQTGFTNEVDILVDGQVAGPYDAAGVPPNVTWQCQEGIDIQTSHPQAVALVTSVADFAQLLSGNPGGSNLACNPAASQQPTPTPSPPASPGASPSAAPPSPSTSPTARRTGGDTVQAASTQPATGGATAVPAPSASASPGAATTPSPAPGGGSASSAKVQTKFLCDLRAVPQLTAVLMQPVAGNTVQCPPIDEYQRIFVTLDNNGNPQIAHDPTPLDPTSARIVLGVSTTALADQAALIDSLRKELASAPNGLHATPTGLVVLAAQAYDNLTGRALILNIVPLLLVFVVLLAAHRNLRRALLPVIPTALAAGWAPLVIYILGGIGHIGGAETSHLLGSYNPLTVVMGGIVIALATEFGVVLLSRYDEERARGLSPQDAAALARQAVGRAIRISAITLAGGFAVLALSFVVPNSLPLLTDFGLVVVIDLGLAVLAVFAVMLPLAMVIDQRGLELVVAEGPAVAHPEVAPELEPPAEPEPEPEAQPEPEPETPQPRAGRRPGVSGRRRPSAATDAVQPEEKPQTFRPGVSGRRRKGPKRDSGAD